MTAEEFAGRIEKARPPTDDGGWWSGCCPAHEDRNPSLSWRDGRRGLLVKCHAGCSRGAILMALSLQPRDLVLPRQTIEGLTLAEYARAKGLPINFLRELGLADMFYLGTPAVKIPYLDARGTEVAVQFRLTLTGPDRFRWRRGSRPLLYGLWRLAEGRTLGYVVIVEGPSDTHTLWHYHIPALGLPGADTWKETWAEYLEGIPTLYVVIEPDAGGRAILKWLATSSIRDRVRLVRLPDDTKDPSDLHLKDPEQFPAAFRVALEDAIPWAESVRVEATTRGREAWAKCEALAQAPRILDMFVQSLARQGVVGEERAGKLLFLALISRFLDRPVSVVLKGPSSGGKSWVAQIVLLFFPPHTYYALTAMSERALAYSTEPLAHRFLILYEAGGVHGDFANYLMRSLLSEDRVRYETVEKTKDGLRPRLIEREGPTGLLLTTTAIRLHAENETRLLSVPITDTRDQTGKVLRHQAQRANGQGHDEQASDLIPWHALQVWLEGAQHRVQIPYAHRLAELIPPVAVRLRRDFQAVLSLIKAHAILHQATRARDEGGAIVATLDDYAAVHELVADLIGEGVEVSVSTTVRETVKVVETLSTTPSDGVTVKAVAQALKLDTSTVLRRVRLAIDAGFVKNLEDRKGRPARLVRGEPLPEDEPVLPSPHDPRLVGDWTVGPVSGGVYTPPSPLKPSPEGEGGIVSSSEFRPTVQPPSLGNAVLESWECDLNDAPSTPADSPRAVPPSPDPDEFPRSDEDLFDLNPPEPWDVEPAPPPRPRRGRRPTR